MTPLYPVLSQPELVRQISRPTSHIVELRHVVQPRQTESYPTAAPLSTGPCWTGCRGFP